MKLLRPIEGRITQVFGEHPDWYAAWGLSGHEGLDYSATVGTHVKAAHAGTVTRGSDPTGYGLYIAIEGPEVRTMYAHLSQQIAVGSVAAGDVIGLSGNTGNSTGPHLHFGVRPKPTAWGNGYKGYVDPEPWLAEQQEGESMAVSKLGVHFQGPAELGTEATELVRGSRMSWVKGIDVDRWPSPAREMFPRQQVIGRFWIGGDAIERDHYMKRGAAGAEAYFAMLRPRYDKCLADGCSYFEGPNEPHPTAEGNDPAVCEAFELRWAQLVVGIGGKPLVWSIGNGWFARDTAQLFTESIAYACAHGGGLAKHEYGAPSVLSGDGWWTFQTKHILEELYAAGLPRGSVRVFITECGLTWAVMVGKPDVGWKGNSSWHYPDGEDGLPGGGMTEERYWRQISAYDDGYADTPEIVCLLPFTTCPTAQWYTHDFGGSLIRRIVAKHNMSVMPPVEPPTPPTNAPTDDAIRNAAWNAVGIPYNPTAAFPKYAREHGLGIPMTGEFTLGDTTAQGYAGAVVCAVTGDWANIREVAW